MDGTNTRPRSKYASQRTDKVVDLAKVRRRAATRAFNQSDRKLGFARVSEDEFGPLASLAGDLSLGLILTLRMRSGLTTTKHNEGWIALPQAALQQVGLSSRWRRGRVVRRLVACGVLEIRRPSPGAASEYRLLPKEQWQLRKVGGGRAGKAAVEAR
jgi:hypothetical protein